MSQSSSVAGSRNHRFGFVPSISSYARSQSLTSTIR